MAQQDAARANAARNTATEGGLMKRKRPGVVSRADGITLRRIALSGGLVVTHRGSGEIDYTLRASGERVSSTVARRLIERRVLLAEDRGLFDAYPQSYRTRVPADGKLRISLHRT
jgi:hypothetical protein